MDMSMGMGMQKKSEAFAWGDARDGWDGLEAFLRLRNDTTCANESRFL